MRTDGRRVRVLVAHHDIVGVTQAATAESPFIALPGTWAAGTIALSDGAKERIRCQATYRLDNPVNLRLEMSCTSDRFRFELRSHITYEDQTISGPWNETTRGVGGKLPAVPPTRTFRRELKGRRSQRCST